MKLKKGFVLREVCGDYMVVPVGTASIDYKSVIRLNETGAFIWRLISDGQTDDEIVEKITASYDIDENTAREDLRVFSQDIAKAGICDE